MKGVKIHPCAAARAGLFSFYRFWNISDCILVYLVVIVMLLRMLVSSPPEKSIPSAKFARAVCFSLSFN